MSTAYTKINILTNKKMIVSKTYLCLKKHNLSVEDYYANPQKFIEGIKDSKIRDELLFSIELDNTICWN